MGQFALNVKMPALRAIQARWIRPGMWIQFRNKSGKLYFLPVAGINCNNPMMQVAFLPPPEAEVSTIVASCFDLITYQQIYPYDSNDAY